jgi:2-phosphoglycerate kinase
MIYLIGGRPRSGKSILRKRILEKYKISGISTDTLRYMLSEADPLLGVHHTRTAKQNAPIMMPYIDKLIEHLIKYDEEDFVVEGAVLIPELLSKYVSRKNIRCCYLGYSNLTTKEKLKATKEHERDNDWTKNYSMKEFKNFIKNSINKSKKEKKECEKYNIKYFDIDQNFDESINKVIKYLFSKMD